MHRPLLIIVAVLALAGCGTTSFQPAADVPPVTVQPADLAPPEPPVGTPVALAIPKLGVVDEVIPVGLADGNEMELPPIDKTGWYRYAPKPGQRGPAVLASHVNWQGVQGAFSRLHELAVGDEVTVTDDAGVKRLFRVYDVRTIKKEAFQTQTVPWVFGARTTTELMLVTCGGRLSGPEYDSNVIAAARLVT